MTATAEEIGAAMTEALDRERRREARDEQRAQWNSHLRSGGRSIRTFVTEDGAIVEAEGDQQPRDQQGRFQTLDQGQRSGDGAQRPERLTRGSWEMSRRLRSALGIGGDEDE